MIRKSLLMLSASACFLASCENAKKATQTDAQSFIDNYTKQYVQLYTNSSNAQWKSNTEIVEGDSTNTINARKADEAMAAFTGSKENIDKARKLLEQKDMLSDLQKKQLQLILYAAANNPQTVADL